MADTEDSRERNRAANRARYAANPEYYIARAAQWIKDNKEKRRAARRVWYAANREKVLAYQRAYLTGWREENAEWDSYYKHKQSANMRGIPFLLTFDEWCVLWSNSGKFAERGRRKGQYVMARHGDVGPYAVDNVKIVTCGENVSEAHLGKPRRRHR